MKLNLDRFRQKAALPDPVEAPLTIDEKNAHALDVYAQLEMLLKTWKRDIDNNSTHALRMETTIYESMMDFRLIRSKQTASGRVIDESPLYVRVGVHTDFSREPEFSLHIRGAATGLGFENRPVILDKTLSIETVGKMPELIMAEIQNVLHEDEKKSLNISMIYPWKLSDILPAAPPPAPR